jgi:hypothetical protein
MVFLGITKDPRLNEEEILRASIFIKLWLLGSWYDLLEKDYMAVKRHT